LARPFGYEQILTPEQRQQLREALEEERDRLAELDRKLVQARRELEEIVTAEKLNEAALRQKATAIGELEGERSLIRARAFATIRPSLSAEQLERLKNRPGGPPPVPADPAQPRQRRVTPPSATPPPAPK
jgi:Spy/CpxP family protein refolding chaperone